MGYSTAFEGAQTNSLTGPIGFIMSILMYCVFSLILTYSAYHLVQTAPDAILKWIGGSDDDAIGVKNHSDQAFAMVSTSRSAGGQMARNVKSGMDEGKKERAKAANTHQPGATSTSNNDQEN